MKSRSKQAMIDLPPHGVMDPFQPLRSSEVFLAPNELEAGLAVHVALDVQLAAQHFRSAEEHPRLGRRVDLANASERCIPIWPPKVRGGAQAGDGVLVGIGVVDHDIRSIVRLDLSGQVLKGVPLMNL